MQRGLKTHIISAAAVWLSVALVLTTAAFGDQGKIGYISSARVFREYVGAADVQKQFKKDVEEWRQKAQDMKAEIDKLSQELKSQALMLSEEAKERKRSELEQKRREYERFITDIWGPDGKAARREIELTKPLVNKMDKILEKLAAEEEFDLILDIDEASIVYSKEGLDLTDRVLEELNKEMVPVVSTGEKAKLAVFRFKEMSAQAMEGNYGRQISDLLERALLQLALFEAWEGNLGDALIQEGIDKEEEVDEKRAVDVCRIAGDDVAVIGSVTKLGATIEVEVKMLDVKTGDVLTTEQGKTTRSETQEDILPVIGDLASRLAKAYKPK
ncbi:MAG: OmpH family outer membrane protein [bacterium]